MKNIKLTSKIFLFSFSIIVFSSCQKKTGEALNSNSATLNQKAETAIAKKKDPLNAVAYLKYGILGTEVIDSTSEMVKMIDMMLPMFAKEVEREVMINKGLIMEYMKDESGNITSRTFYDARKNIKTSYTDDPVAGKVFTIYDKNIAPDTEDEVSKRELKTKIEPSDKTIKGYSTKMSVSDDGRQKMVAYFTEDLPGMNNPKFASKSEPAGTPLQVDLYLEGVKVIIGLADHSHTLPNPELFEFDKSEYKEVSNDEFPAKRGMF